MQITYLINTIFNKCSMLQQTQSRPNRTSYGNFHFNEFVANALHDNKGLKNHPLTSGKKGGLLLVLKSNI